MLFAIIIFWLSNQSNLPVGLPFVGEDHPADWPFLRHRSPTRMYETVGPSTSVKDGHLIMHQNSHRKFVFPYSFERQRNFHVLSVSSGLTTQPTDLRRIMISTVYDR